MNSSLKGRVALVTGAGQGIGQGIARALAAAGASLVLAQRTAVAGRAEARYLRDTYGVEAHAVTTDVTCPEQVEAMVKAAVTGFGRLDILVNNAGVSHPKRLESLSDQDMTAGMDINFMAVFRAMRAAFPVMRQQGFGRIINIGSLNGVNAHMFTAPYNAGKEAMRALSRTAAVEWATHGITVNIICPASTSPQAKAYFEANPEMHARIIEQIPAGRMGDPADIGSVATFLASEASSFMTGNTLFVDGGSHINGVHWRPEVAD